MKVTRSKRTSPPSGSPGAASASVSWCGGVRVCIPSSTSPTLAYIAISVKLTHPVICAILIEIAPAAVMSPAVASPRDQSHRVPPISRTGRMPASVIRVKRKPADRMP